MAKYLAKKGDTLKKLAKKYGVKRKTLRELNPDMKFGKAKSKGGEGFAKLKGEEIRLGEGVGTPMWKTELLQDPKYAGFLRKFDFDRDVLGDQFQALKDRQARELVRKDVEFDNQLIDNHQRINENADSRGLFRSGQRHIDRGDATSKMALKRQSYVDSQGEAREEGRRAKREGIAELKRKRSEERLGARERLSVRDAETEYM